MESDRELVDLGEAVDADAIAAEKQRVRQPKRRFIGRKEAAERAERDGGQNKSKDEGDAVQGRW